jgi:hypothetical protein
MSRLFDHLSNLQLCYIERHEVSSRNFSILRHQVRSMVEYFGESDEQDAHEIANRLRSVLSEWLTVPIPFNCSCQYLI